MIEKIFRLGKEAAVYGLSSILGRLLNFILVPFYTNLLLTSEYGVVANIYAYIAFVFVVYGYGMEAAYMRYVSSLEIGDRKQNFSAPFFSHVITSIVFSVGIHVAAPVLAQWIGIDPSQASLIRYAGWILFFDTLAIIPFASLRMENKAFLFASLRILNIVINVVFNIVFIVGFGMKAEGVLIANLLASGLTFVILFSYAFPQVTFRFSKKLYSELLRFGLPYVPAGIAGIAMQVIDRPILKALTDDATVGIYQANYRLGVLMMLVVGMFDYAWRPFFLSHANDPDAKPLFARVFTYFVAFMSFILVSVSLFIDDLVRIQIFGRYFIHPDYWGGLSIVPWILLSYVFTGAYVNFVVGVYLEKKTKYLPYATGAGGAVNVAINFWLIPKFGMLGAAYATLLSYIVMAVGIYFASQKFYYVEYEWSKIIRSAFATVIVFFAYSFFSLQPATVQGVTIKGLLCVVFVVLLVGLRVFEPSEILRTKQAISRMFGKS